MNKAILLSILLAFALVGCAIVAQPLPPSESVIQTAIAQTQAAAPKPTDTPNPPTATPLPPTPTPIPTETPTETPTEVPTEPVPTQDYSGVSVLTAGHLQNGGFLVTIQYPFEIEGEYRAVVDTYDFTCEILIAYPDRLYCTGPDLSPSQYTILVFVMEQDEALFELDFTVPDEDVFVSEPKDDLMKEPREPKEPKETEEPEPEPYPYP